MISFMYTIKAPVGMHARHAGLLVRQASQFESDIFLYLGERGANAKRVLGLMGLGVKQGDLVRLTVEGPDEAAAAQSLKGFLFENF